MYNNRNIERKLTEPDIKNTINALITYQNEVIHEQHNELLSLTNAAACNTTNLNRVVEQLQKCMDEKKSLKNIADIYSAKCKYYSRIQFPLCILLFILSVVLIIYTKN